LEGAMTQENVGLKSAPAEQAHLPQHEDVFMAEYWLRRYASRSGASETGAPPQPMYTLSGGIPRATRAAPPPNANRDLEVERWRYVEAPAFPDSALR
jgi:hypothetical protein